MSFLTFLFTLLIEPLELVFETIIARNVKLSEAPSYGLPAILYDADSKGAKNYLALAQEILKKNGKK